MHRDKTMGRVWYIWSDKCGGLSVATKLSGLFIVRVAGSFTWDETTVWMRSNGVPGW
jgi:hypothetical protein